MSTEFGNDRDQTQLPPLQAVDVDLGLIDANPIQEPAAQYPGWRRAVASAGAVAFLGTGSLLAAGDYEHIQETMPETVYGTVACVSTDPVNDVTASTTQGERLDVAWRRELPEGYLATFSTTLPADERFKLRVTCGTDGRSGEITEEGSIPATAKGTIVTCDGVEGPVADFTVTEGGCKATFDKLD